MVNNIFKLHNTAKHGPLVNEVFKAKDDQGYDFVLKINGQTNMVEIETFSAGFIPLSELYSLLSTDERRRVIAATFGRTLK